MEIIPALLERNLKELEAKLKSLQKHFDRFHIDVIDSKFNNQTIELVNLPKFNNNFFVEAHLMIAKPEDFLREIKFKNIDLVFGQIEVIKDFNKYLERDEKYDLGLAIDLETEVDKYEKEIKKVRNILLMAVKAGKSGQVFDVRVLDKIKKVRQIVGESAEILVDGGINLKTAKDCLEAGVDGALVNSFLWEDFENNLYELRLLDLLRNKQTVS